MWELIKFKKIWREILELLEGGRMKGGQTRRGWYLVGSWLIRVMIASVKTIQI